MKSFVREKDAIIWCDHEFSIPSRFSLLIAWYMPSQLPKSGRIWKNDSRKMMLLLKGYCLYSKIQCQFSLILPNWRTTWWNFLLKRSINLFVWGNEENRGARVKMKSNTIYCGFKWFLLYYLWPNLTYLARSVTWRVYLMILHWERKKKELVSKKVMQTNSSKEQLCNSANKPNENCVATL